MSTVYKGVGNFSNEGGDAKYDGVGTFPGGTYGSVVVDGVFSCSGDLMVSALNINGVFNCKGSLTADTFECDGTAKFEQGIRAKQSDVDGFVEVEGDFEGTTIKCDGVIKAAGTISADLIEADGFLDTREIVGEKIVIKSRQSLLTGKFSFKKRFLVDLIEATTIELRGVHAKQVNGHDISIGAKCEIENIDCSGTLTVDKHATVNNVTGTGATTTHAE